MRRLPSVPTCALLLGLLLSGCSGPRGPAFRPEVVEQSGAMIYVYRPARHWGGAPIGVYLDQRYLGRLSAGQYLACPVEPGQRLVRAEGRSDSVRLVTLGAADSAFLEVRASYWDERPAIEVPDEQAARSRIARTVKVDAPR